MERRMSPLHQAFANSPSLQHRLPSNSILDRIPTLEQLSHRQDESDNSFARRSSEDASSVSTGVLDAHAETSWTVWSAESVVSVPCAPAAFQNPAHPAYPQPSQGSGVAAASAAAPSAHGAPEAAGSAPTQLPREFFEALSDLSDPKPGETENRLRLRQLAGAREIKGMARDKAALCGSMVERGAAEVLVSVVNGVIEAEERKELMDLRYKVAEEAAAALLNLSLDKTAKHMMRSRGVIPCVVRLAGVTRGSPHSHDDPDARGSRDLPYDAQQDDFSSFSENGARSPPSTSARSTSAPCTSASPARLRLRELAVEIIHSLAKAPALKEDLVDQSVVEPLVGLLREPACSTKGRMHALYTLYLLSMCGPGRSALVNRGAVPLLLEVALCGMQKGSHLYAEQSDRFFEKALHALANVSKEQSGRSALVNSKTDYWFCENGAAGSNVNPQSGHGSCIQVSGLQGLFKLLVNERGLMQHHALTILHQIIRNAGKGNSSEQVLEEIWFLLQKEKPRRHFKALANAGSHKAQQLLMVLFPVGVAIEAGKR